MAKNPQTKPAASAPPSHDKISPETSDLLLKVGIAGANATKSDEPKLKMPEEAKATS